MTLRSSVLLKIIRTPKGFCSCELYQFVFIAFGIKIEKVKDRGKEGRKKKREKENVHKVRASSLSLNHNLSDIFCETW